MNAATEFKHVLVFYKTSTYQHSLKHVNRLSHFLLKPSHLNRFKETHQRHYRTLEKTEAFLKKAGIPYRRAKRGQRVDFSRHDLVISVGGDGTILEAAQGIKDQVLLGINSDPKWSIGKFCGAVPSSMEATLQRLFAGKIRPVPIARLRVISLPGTEFIDILNDVLVCHKNPAAMSRYFIQAGKTREEQKSSGVWISTAAGSTAAIHSAGGKLLSITNNAYQYRPRELYYTHPSQYSLTGGLLNTGQRLSIISLMKEGVVYCDGSHKRIALPLGKKLVISRSPHPLRLILPPD